MEAGVTVTYDTVQEWAHELTAVAQRIAPLFARSEARQQAVA